MARPIRQDHLFQRGVDRARRPSGLEVDVQAPGHPLLKLMDFNVDREKRTITTGLSAFRQGHGGSAAGFHSHYGG